MPKYTVYAERMACIEVGTYEAVCRCGAIDMAKGDIPEAISEMRIVDISSDPGNVYAMEEMDLSLEASGIFHHGLGWMEEDTDDGEQKGVTTDDPDS